MIAKSKEMEEESSPPAFATPVPLLSSVEDLERRLKLIGNASPSPAPSVEDLKPAATPAPVPVAATTSAMSGKTALLVRLTLHTFC